MYENTLEPWFFVSKKLIGVGESIPNKNFYFWFVCIAQFHWTMVNDGKFEISMPSIYKLGWVERKKIIIFSLSYKVEYGLK